MESGTGRERVEEAKPSERAGIDEVFEEGSQVLVGPKRCFVLRAGTPVNLTGLFLRKLCPAAREGDILGQKRGFCFLSVFQI
jgi:hypothetical protein